MSKFYKKVSLTLAASVVAITGMAQSWTVSPAQGTINTEINPAGCAAVELSFSGGVYCNREAEGMISLYRGDLLLAQIPAQNYARIQTVDGYTKYYEPGSAVDISFFESAKGLPTQVPGNYTITIPANFFYTLKDSEPVYNQPITLNYVYPKSATAASGYVFTPEPGDVRNLSTLKITMPEGAVINSVKTESWTEVTEVPIYDEETGEETGEYEEQIDTYYPFSFNQGTPSGPIVLPSAIEYDDTSVTLTFDYKFKSFAYYLNIPEGVISYTLDGDETGNSAIIERYNFISADRIEGMDFPITPAEGEYTSFPAMETGYDAAPLANFILEIPASYVPSPMAYPRLLSVNEDGTIDTKIVAQLPIVVEKVPADAATKRVFLCYKPAGATTVSDLYVAPGKYVVRLPKAFVNNSAIGGMNPDTDYYYTVVASQDATNLQATPASGSELYSISTITAKFDGEVKVANNTYIADDWRNNHPNCYAKITNGIATYIALVDVDADDPTQAIFTVIGEPISTPGEWVFTTPDEYFTINGTKVVCSASFTVIKPEITPAEGSVLSSIDTFKVKVDADDVMVRRGALATLYANADKGQLGAVVAEFECNLDEDNNVVLTPTEGSVGTWAGEYTLVTPAGMFTSSKGMAGRYTYGFIVDSAPLASKPAITPKEGYVKTLDNFVLTVPGALITSVNTGLRAQLFMCDEDGVPYSAFSEAAFIAAIGDEEGTVTLTNVDYYGQEIDIFGEYYLLLTPENLFASDKGYAESYSYFYTIGSEVGIELVEEVPTFDVYSIAGACVLRGADAAALLKLDKGIYIVNGKKVVLK